MRCAVINIATGIVENVIVATPNDPPEIGRMLAWVPDLVNPGDTAPSTTAISTAALAGA